MSLQSQGLRIAGVDFRFDGVAPETLFAPFSSFAAPIEEPDGRYEIRHGVPRALDAAPRFESPIWRLHDSPGGARFEFFVDLESRDQPVMTAEVSRDWSRGALTLDPMRVPARTLGAPVSSPFGELALMSLISPRGLYVHASAALGPNGVDVFLGKSGAGKTTLAGIARASGAAILSDDRTVLRVEDGRLFAYGTPFHGTGRHWSCQSGPVRGLYFLEQSMASGLTRMPHALAAARLASFCFTKFWDRAEVERALEFCGVHTASVPSYVLRFRPDATALATIEAGAHAP